MTVQFTDNFVGRFAGQKVIGSLGQIAEVSDEVGADLIQQGFAIRIDEPAPEPKPAKKKVL